jgi:hypothetical protein
MAYPITLNPGAPSEMTAEPGAIPIPDLWHLAQALKNGPITRSKAVQARAGADILELWHLAHALRRYIIDHQETEPPGIDHPDCLLCVCQECGGTFRVGDCAQRVRHGSTTVRAEFVHLRCLTTYQEGHGTTIKEARA